MHAKSLEIRDRLDKGLRTVETTVRSYFDGFVLPGTNDLESCSISRCLSRFSRHRSSRSKRA